MKKAVILMRATICVAALLLVVLVGCPDEADTTPPARVTLIASDPDGGTVQLSWQEPGDADFAYLEISWTPPPPDGATPSPLQVAKGTATATIQGLRIGTYVFTAISVDTTGNRSAPSEPVSVTITSVTPLAVTLVATADGNTAKLTWNQPDDPNFSHLLISWTPTGGDRPNPLKVDAGTTEASISGLPDGTYTFSAVSVNIADDQSAPSADVSLVINVHPPSQVELLRSFVASGERSVTLSWGAPSAPTDTDFSHVLISWAPAGGSPTGPLQVPKGTNTVTIDGLGDDVYRFTAISVDTASSESTPSTTTAIINGPLPPPTLTPLTPSNPVTITGESTINISWEEPRGPFVVADDDFSHVLISWTPTGGTTANPLQVSAGTTTATIAGLTPGTSYTFTATSVDMTDPNDMTMGGNVSEPSAPIEIAAGDVDWDNDGLIDVHTLAHLDNIRHNLAGTSYDDEDDDGTGNEGITGGAPTAPTANCATEIAGDYLCGYELMGNLDFDTDNTDGAARSWTDTTFALDANDDYYNNGAGWVPIGENTADDRFTAIFEGNGNTIDNLAIKTDSSTDTAIGLFGAIGGSANIRNLNLTTALADYTGTTADVRMGSLVGYMDNGSIANISVSDDSVVVDEGSGGNIAIGGLVGYQNGGSITASSAAGTVNGGTGTEGRVGGLVGQQNGGSIIASNATASVSVGGNTNHIGGLVGYQDNASIIGSYATGNVVEESQGASRVGGLVGHQNSDSLIASSYATGNATGGTLGADFVGGLVGGQTGVSSFSNTMASEIPLIVNSYATGTVDGGNGNGDIAGGLVGYRVNTASVIASYATGSVMGGDGTGDGAGALVGGDSIANSQIEHFTTTASYGFGTVNNNDETHQNTVNNNNDRSDDASPEKDSEDNTVVGDATDLTQAKSSTEDDNEWSTTAWDFDDATINRHQPFLKWITAYTTTMTTMTSSCDSSLLAGLPGTQTCNQNIPGQVKQ